jgi:hypothetical protein
MTFLHGKKMLDQEVDPRFEVQHVNNYTDTENGDYGSKNRYIIVDR